MPLSLGPNLACARRSLVDHRGAVGIDQVLVLVQQTRWVLILRQRPILRGEGESVIITYRGMGKYDPAIPEYQGRVGIRNYLFTTHVLLASEHVLLLQEACLYGIGEHLGLRAQPRHRRIVLRSHIVKVIIQAAVV